MLAKWCAVAPVCLILAGGSLLFAADGSKKGNKGGSENNAIKTQNSGNLPAGSEKKAPEVKHVDPALRDAALASAAKIDALVEGQLKKAGQTPHALASDEVFLRRAYLNITGAIPNSRQTESFLNSKIENKRVILVDFLLNRSGYASQMYNWLADILRLVDRGDENVYTRPYSDWVKQSLRDDRPWDDMVRQMLTAEGRVWENPPAGFVMRDQGMPLDNLNNAVRIFLGTRIGCAQCHDHPFDRWTQKEFYQLAAFTAGIEYRPPMSERVPLKQTDLDPLTRGEGQQVIGRSRLILRMNQRGISDHANKQLHYPHDYQYSNAKANEVAQPAVLWGPTISHVGATNRRQALAEWVTSAENPRFALTIANRLWQKAMGLGLIEPLDDLKDDTVASNPELMAHLSSELKRLKFDLKEFQRILFLTQTFQRQATYDELAPEKPYLFPGPVLRRMTAEQVWDSLLTLTLEHPDTLVRPDDHEYVATISLSRGTTPAQVVDKAKHLIDEKKQENKERKTRMYQGAELMRASELPQPLDEGHFLRQFGQSDRENIATSHIDGTVPQMLTMFNGPVTHMMLEGGSVIYNEVVAEKGLSDQVDRIFLCVLNRHPREAEKAAALREMRTTGAAGYGNVIWALLNTREFLFIQ